MTNHSLLKKLLAVFLTFALFACMPKDDKPQVRIVDLQGKARNVTTRYPELNVPALNAQGKAYEKTSQGAFSNSIKVTSSPTYVKKDEVALEVPLNQDQPLNTKQNEIGVNSVTQPLKENPNVNQGAANAGVDEVVEYDLGQEAPVVTSKKDNKSTKVSKDKPIANNSSTKGQYFVQVGSFSSESSAKDILKKMKKFHTGRIETVNGEKTYHRVWLGPFSNKSKANELVKKIKASGSSAILVKDR
jgi:cell division protein FtsN